MCKYSEIRAIKTVGMTYDYFSNLKLYLKLIRIIIKSIVVNFNIVFYYFIMIY